MILKKELGPAQYLLLIAVALAAMALGAGLGTTELRLESMWQSDSPDFHIFWNLRIPRVIVAFCAGGSLALCGMVFQAVYLNPLATPYTLGVSSGAGCGAALVIYMAGLSGTDSGLGIMAGAFGGASAAMLLVLWFGRTRQGRRPHAMLLAGVAVSFFFSSLLLLIQSLASFYQSFQIVRWLMGGIAVAGYREVLLLAPITIIAVVVILSQGKRLNLLLLGDELAHSRGMNVGAAKNLLFITVSVTVAATVSITGPIGFVGMVVPHMGRMLWGNHHGKLAPAVVLLGGSMLVICDLAARLIMAPTGIPVGVVTALIGAPFFFFLLMTGRYRL